MLLALGMLEQSTISRIPLNIDSAAIAVSPPRPRIAVFDGLLRRLRRERRRRKVGRAYDMALEIAQYVPRYSRILDAGCGNGYIAHHLTGLVEADVTGIDLAPTTEAPIDYKQFNGINFTVRENSFDVVLLCYVLHHAQNLNAVLAEVSRALTDGGIAVVYEDMPERWWDRFVCALHNLKWRRRTGPCTFRSSAEWWQVFTFAGFEVMFERDLSRWRNLAHPVKRRLFIVRRDPERI